MSGRRPPESPESACIMPRPILLALAILPFAGCSGGSPSGAAGEDSTTLERIRRAGVARIGYANESPYAYKDSATGRLTGEAPEIAREIFARMGVPEVEGVLADFAALIPGLKAGRFDVVAAGMYIKPERCREIAFSNPTYSIGEAFAVASGNPKSLHSYEDVAARPDAKLGVVTGTVERGYARDTGIPDERVVSFPDPASALAGVRAGRVDAYAGTSLTVRGLIAKAGEGVEAADPFVDPEIGGQTVRGYGAFGFRKEDADLLAEFDRGLAEFIGSPEHLELVRPFGFTENELPGGTTAAELCGG